MHWSITKWRVKRITHSIHSFTLWDCLYTSLHFCNYYTLLYTFVNHEVEVWFSCLLNVKFIPSFTFIFALFAKRAVFGVHGECIGHYICKQFLGFWLTLPKGPSRIQAMFRLQQIQSGIRFSWQTQEARSAIKTTQYQPLKDFIYCRYKLLQGNLLIYLSFYGSISYCGVWILRK